MSSPSAPPDTRRPARRRPHLRPVRVGELVRAIQEGDEAQIEEAVIRLSRQRRALKPLVFCVSAFVLLFNGLKLLVSNWRLTLVQALPAMWIWLATFDLKAHVLHGKSFNVIRGPILIPIGGAIIAITVAAFFLNAVFAFAISGTGRPEVRPAVAKARRHLAPIAMSGAIAGALLAFATTIATRWGRPWFSLALGLVIGLMMVCYVAVPARVIGVTPSSSRRDKFMTSLLGGVLGATICTPPYALGRIGLLMIGSDALRIPGVVVLVAATGLQAGATGAVRAIKLSAALTGSGQRPARVTSRE